MTYFQIYLSFVVWIIIPLLWLISAKLTSILMVLDGRSVDRESLVRSQLKKSETKAIITGEFICNRLDSILEELKKRAVKVPINCKSLEKSIVNADHNCVATTEIIAGLLADILKILERYDKKDRGAEEIEKIIRDGVHRENYEMLKARVEEREKKGLSK